MGCGVAFLKWILIIIHVMYAILGAVILGFGIFVEMSSQEKLIHVTHEVVDTILALPATFNMNDATPSSGELTVDFTELLDSLAVPLIIVGAVLLAWSLIGGLGACCMSRALLIAYVVVSVFAVLYQLVVVILLLTGKLDSLMRDKLMDTIKTDYRGIDDYSVHALTLNYFMIRLECCGAETYLDFENAAEWDRVRAFAQDGVTVNTTLVTPIACCKFLGEFPDVTPVDEMCAIAPSDENSNWKTACWPLMLELIDIHEKPIIDVTITALAIQIVLITATIIVSRSLRKAKESVAP